jgi:hypothetical protein
LYHPIVQMVTFNFSHRNRQNQYVPNHFISFVESSVAPAKMIQHSQHLFFKTYKSRIIWINLQLASDCFIIHLEDRLIKGHLISLVLVFVQIPLTMYYFQLADKNNAVQIEEIKPQQVVNWFNFIGQKLLFRIDSCSW